MHEPVLFCTRVDTGTRTRSSPKITVSNRRVPACCSFIHSFLTCHSRTCQHALVHAHAHPQGRRKPKKSVVKAVSVSLEPQKFLTGMLVAFFTSLTCSTSRCVCCTKVFSFSCQAAKENRKHTEGEDELCWVSKGCAMENCKVPRPGHLCYECREDCHYDDHADAQCRWCYQEAELARYKDEDGEEEGEPVPLLLPCSRR